MEFKVQKPKTFDFVIKDGKKEIKHELPLIQYLPAKWQKSFADLNRYNDKNPTKVAVAVDIEMELLNEYCEGATEILTGEQVNELINAWNDASSISMGE